MVACPFCQEIVSNEGALQVHLVKGCSGGSVDQDEVPACAVPSKDETYDPELVEVQFQWQGTSTTSSYEIYLISSLAGSVPMFKSNPDEGRIYESKYTVVPAGDHECQLVVGENIYPVKVITITPMTGIATVEIDEDSAEGSEPLEYGLLNEQEQNEEQEMAYNKNHGRREEGLSSGDEGLSPLYRELIQHQVVHGEPNWVPKDSDVTPEDFAFPSEDSALTDNGPSCLSLSPVEKEKGSNDIHKNSKTNVKCNSEEYDGIHSSFEHVKAEEGFASRNDLESSQNHCLHSIDKTDVTRNGLSLPSVPLRTPLDSVTHEAKTLALATPKDARRAREHFATSEVSYDQLEARCFSYEEEVLRLRKDKQELLHCVLKNEGKEDVKLLKLREDIEKLKQENERLVEENESIKTAHLLREEDLRKMNLELEEEINDFRTKVRELEYRLETEHRSLLKENERITEENRSQDTQIKSLRDENMDLRVTVEKLRNKSDSYLARTMESKSDLNWKGGASHESDKLMDDINLVLEGFRVSTDDSISSSRDKQNYSYKKFSDDDNLSSPEPEKVVVGPTDLDSLSDYYSVKSFSKTDINGNYYNSLKSSYPNLAAMSTEKGKHSDYPAIRRSLLDQPLDTYRHLSRKSRSSEKITPPSSIPHDLFKDYAVKNYDFGLNNSYPQCGSLTGSIGKSYERDKSRQSLKSRRERPHSFHEGNVLSKSVFDDDISLEETSSSFNNRSTVPISKKPRASRSYSSGIDEIGRSSETSINSWSLNKHPLRPFAPKSFAEVQAGMRIAVIRSTGGVARGVVRWCGYLPRRKEAYVGVELAASGGLNDGVVDGIRYFHCEPGYGLFVPYGRVLMLWDYRSIES